MTSVNVSNNMKNSKGYEACHTTGIVSVWCSQQNKWHSYQREGDSQL